MKTPTIIFENEIVEKIPNHSLICEGEWIQDSGESVFVQDIKIGDEIYKKMICGGIIQIWKKPTPITAKWGDGEPRSIPNFPMKVVWEISFPSINVGYIRNITDMNIKMDDQGEIVVRWKIETHQKSTDLGAANDDYFQSYKQVFYNIEDLKEWLKEPLFVANGSPQFRHEIDMSKLDNLE